MTRKKKTTVAVLYNFCGEDVYEKMRTVDPETLGFKPEYDINVATVTEEYEAVAKALRKKGYQTTAININEELQSIIKLLRKNPPDVVFNLIEYFRDEPKLEYLIAGLFVLHGIRYTGAPPFTLALCQRKGMTKQLLLANNVPTPRYRLLTEPHIPRRHGLHYPMIIKPGREDARSGVDKSSVVYDSEQFKEQIEK